MAIDIITNNIDTIISVSGAIISWFLSKKAKNYKEDAETLSEKSKEYRDEAEKIYKSVKHEKDIVIIKDKINIAYKEINSVNVLNLPRGKKNLQPEFTKIKELIIDISINLPKGKLEESIIMSNLNDCRVLIDEIIEYSDYTKLNKEEEKKVKDKKLELDNKIYAILKLSKAL